MLTEGALPGVLSEGWFTLGPGSGEALNEHVAVNAELPGTSAFAAASQAAPDLITARKESAG